MATLKLYNPILSEATKECYWFCDEAGTSFKDVDAFINSIPTGDQQIELLLHCDGGEVREGWAIVDKLRSTGKKITATIEGSCASMASVVLLAASERRAYPHATLLVHKPYYPEYTLSDAYRAEELETLAASLREDERRMLDFYVERTGADRAELEALMGEDRFIDMELAKELGFIQTIIPAASASAVGSKSAKAAAWQRKTTTTNHNSMATKTTKGEDKSVLRKAIAALAAAVGLESVVPTAVSYELNTESGDTITIDKPDGEDPAVGDSASPDGEHKMPDGKTIVIEDGVITEIRDAEEEPEDPEDDPDSDALAEANTRVAQLEAELADARKNAKTTDEKRILNLVAIAGGEQWLVRAKSDYKPAARQTTTASGGKKTPAQPLSRVQQRIAQLEAAQKTE
ncbi:ATP-dependent Clp protease proteolytic subunit [Alistipes sp.]|uniref:ATP-dependent Clp protease proteolytic subunit n=1 Tax=Alistipes sp. TaxID=1872444 RepID=UPI003AF0D392